MHGIATTEVASAASTSNNTAETPTQSSSALHSPLQHQSKSFPPRLQRTPSISSQSSIECSSSTPTRQSVSSNKLNFIGISFKRKISIEFQ